MTDSNSTKNGKLIVANCSGFFGDRFSGMKEMVEGGPIDFLTGDYLAELTMAILFRQNLKNPSRGYASTFLRQMEEVMGQCLDKKIRVVSNAGGLNPKNLAEELKKTAEKLGLHPKIAYIEGDNLIPRLVELQELGETFAHLDKGTTLKEANAQSITANAYLGGWGVAKALEKGADIVVGGRLADAAVVMGPAAWHFGWKQNDWDRLAGAAVAGHIIECSGQATGGNYSFIDEVPSYKKVGFPIAEMYEDGSFVITKHPGTGGLVSVGTVTAQLLYEIKDPKYLTPDVAARFDTINISQEAPDRVLVKDVRGEPAPNTTKVCINNQAGHRNSMTLILTGLDIEKKAQIVEEALFDAIGGKEQFQQADVQLIPSAKEDPPSNDEAFAHLRISVLDPDAQKVARLSANIIELTLANIPGFVPTTPPGKGSQAIQHWPALVSVQHIQQKIVIDDEEVTLDSGLFEPLASIPQPMAVEIPEPRDEKTVRVPLGRVYATRSGDKGGNANLGIWGKTPESYAYLHKFLTVEKLKELLQDMRQYDIDRYEIPNLYALNFYIKGVLGDGVASSLRSDPQAKTLGEYLRAKIVDLPESFLG
jgi:hypothetical protein